MKAALYKINFNPNCICLDVVAVAVIRHRSTATKSEVKQQ